MEYSISRRHTSGAAIGSGVLVCVEFQFGKKTGQERACPAKEKTNHGETIEPGARGWIIRTRPIAPHRTAVEEESPPGGRLRSLRDYGRQELNGLGFQRAGGCEGWEAAHFCLCCSTARMAPSASRPQKGFSAAAA